MAVIDFLRRQWADSQPFGYLGLVLLYFFVTGALLSERLGWVLMLFWFFNPMTVRVLYRLWARRDELDEMATNMSVILRSKREDDDE